MAGPQAAPAQGVLEVSGTVFVKRAVAEESGTVSVMRAVDVLSVDEKECFLKKKKDFGCE